MAPHVKYPQLHDQAWMQEHYVGKQLTIYEIAAQLGCSNEAVFLALRRNGIKGRTRKQRQRAVKFRLKPCRGCGEVFQPVAACHLYCLTCKPNPKQPAAGRPLCAWCSQRFRVDGRRWTYYSHCFCSADHRALFLQHTDHRTAPRRINKDGYAEIRVGRGYPGARADGFMLEHRYVMEQQLGRSLLASETVHHKHGQRADNKPDKLELWSTSQPSGQRVEDKISWALEFLAQYGTVDFELTTRQIELHKVS